MFKNCIYIKQYVCFVLIIWTSMIFFAFLILSIGLSE